MQELSIEVIELNSHFSNSNTTNNRRPELVRDSKALFIAEIIHIIAGAGIIIILTRDLPLETYGLWVSIIAVFQLSTILNFGFPTHIVRRASKSPTCLSALLKKIRRIQIVIAILTIPACVLITIMLYGSKVYVETPFIIVGFALVASVLQQINRAGLRAIGEAPKEVMVTLLDRVTVLILLILIRILLGISLTLYILAYLSGPILGFFASYYIVSRKTSKNNLDEAEYSMIIKDSAPFAIGLFARPVRDGAIRIILSAIGGFGIVAIFDIAWKAFMAGSSVTVAVRKSMLPLFSAAKEIEGELRKSLNHGWKLANWLVQIGLILGTASSYLIPVVFSDSYQQSQTVFLLLLHSWGVMVISSPWVVAVESLMDGKYFAILKSFQVIVTLFVAVIGIYYFGVMGAAAGILAGELFISWGSFVVTKSQGVPVPEVWGLVSPTAIILLIASINLYLISGSMGPMWLLLPLSINILWMITSGWKPEVPTMSPLTSG
jgi:O-antigen/teichoic acid export membrane protein